MVKVLAACGNGMGSSMVIKMKVENALRKLNQRDFTVNSCSVGEAKGLAVGYDIVIASLHLIQELEGRTNGKLIGLDNLMDDKEITENSVKHYSKGWRAGQKLRVIVSVLLPLK